MRDLNTPDQLRSLMKSQRRAVSAEQINQSSNAIALQLLASTIYQQAQNIASYYPVNGEVDPSIIVYDAWNNNKKTFLPVIQAENRLLFAPYEAQSSMQANHFRIPEPQCAQTSYISAADIDLVITPIVAFDSECHRLGMGAGFYDRAFAGTDGKSPVKIGLAYSFQQIPSIQVQNWDIPMDAVITEHTTYIRKNSHITQQTF